VVISLFITIRIMYAFVVFLMYATDPAYHIKFTSMLMTYLHKFHRPGYRILLMQGPNMWAYRKEGGETP